MNELPMLCQYSTKTEANIFNYIGVYILALTTEETIKIIDGLI